MCFNLCTEKRCSEKGFTGFFWLPPLTLGEAENVIGRIGMDIEIPRASVRAALGRVGRGGVSAVN